MIKIEHIEVSGFRAALRGMRNPLNSWNKSDSKHFDKALYPRFKKNQAAHMFAGDVTEIGENDLKLTATLINAGSPDRKFLRMIHVSMDVTAPLYWWKEYDTYKVSTVANSCSTMHTIHKRPFTVDDFSHDKLELDFNYALLDNIVYCLNVNREKYLETKDKRYWWQMIQLLPTSYNQRRTLDLNYETLRAIYYWRKNHKLDEWRELCKALETLPYAKEFIVN